MPNLQSCRMYKKAFAGDASSQSLLTGSESSTKGGAVIEAGGRIVLGTATTAAVTVVDSLGRVLHNATVTSNTDIAPVPCGVLLPLLATVASSNGSLTVYWFTKE